MLGGVLSEKYGGKWVYGIAAGFSAMLGLLIPVAARTGLGVLVAARAMQGALQGCTTPALYTLCAKWFPKQEKARLYTIVFAGTQS
jgi:ACS family sodium-dependent inorganic phosphate cotransporter